MYKHNKAACVLGIFDYDMNLSTTINGVETLTYEKRKHQKIKESIDSKTSSALASSISKKIYQYCLPCHRTVVVCNIHELITWDIIKAHFQVVGPVFFVYMAHYHDGRHKNYSFVEFYNEKDARRAMILNGSRLMHR